jgi:hypothetical protein
MASKLIDRLPVLARAAGWAAFALLAGSMLKGCRIDVAEPGVEAITAEELDGHLRFLASDLLEGRSPGTRGSELAALYIAGQFALAGLRPAVGDSSFLQSLTLVAALPTASLSFRARGGASFRAEYGPDFVAWSSQPDEPSEVVGELVFVGYGITADEYGWDDFKSADLEGKVLLALVNDPGGPGRFGGDTLTYYGFPDYKFEEAARRGAAGAIVIHTRELAGHGWHVVESIRKGETMLLESGPREDRPAFEAMLSRRAAETVVAMAGLDFATLLESARSQNFRPIATGVTVSARVSSEVRRFVDVNVAGILPGGDPELADEFVVYTAHYDHLGVDAPLDSDSIYNGAYDNASGVALLIALARAYARLQRPPARSILFLAVTAEEPGLLGSTYYVQNPLVPLERTVASINIDGVNLWGPTEDIVVIGAELSDLGGAVAAAAAAEALTLKGDRAPELGYLYRSDQLSFIRRGVPAVQISHGLDYIGRMPGWGAQLMAQYREEDYHKPGDEYRLGLDLRGAVQQGRVAFRTGLAVANNRARPSYAR